MKCCDAINVMIEFIMLILTLKLSVLVGTCCKLSWGMPLLNMNVGSQAMHGIKLNS